MQGVVFRYSRYKHIQIQGIGHIMIILSLYGCYMGPIRPPDAWNMVPRHSLDASMTTNLYVQKNAGPFLLSGTQMMYHWRLIWTLE